MVSGGFSYLGLLVLVALTAAALRVYLPVARTVLVRGAGLVETDWVRLLDLLVALLLAAWFAMQGQKMLLQSGERAVEFRHVLTGAAVYGSVVLFLAGILVYRDISFARAFGWDSEGFGRALWRSLLYIAASYPLLMLAQAMIHGAAGPEAAPQDVVRFLMDAKSPRDRVSVVVMAVAVAPIAEEFIFRGYLYPVAKKYAGPFAALVATSLLFAVVHGHAFSIPALFTLAVCLGLAYERTGSLLVPMIMHAVFNAFQLAVILFVL